MLGQIVDLGVPRSSRGGGANDFEGLEDRISWAAYQEVLLVSAW